MAAATYHQSQSRIPKPLSDVIPSPGAESSTSTTSPHNPLSSDRTSYLIVGVLVIVYFSYQNITSALLRAVNCIDVDDDAIDHEYKKYAIATGTPVWVEDTALRCWKDNHTTTGVFGILGLIFFSCGVIIFIFTWFQKNKRYASDPRFIARYGFLYQAFDPDRYTISWEGVIFLRKGLIWAAVVFAFPLGSSLQALFALGVMILAAAAHLIAAPFKLYPDHPNVPSASEADAQSSNKFQWSSFVNRAWIQFNNSITLNSLESMSLLMSIFIFYAGVMFNDENTGEVVKVLVTILVAWANIGFIVFILYRMYAGLHLVLDMNLLFYSKGQHFQNYFEITKGMSPFAMIHKIITFIRYKHRFREEAIQLDSELRQL